MFDAHVLSLETALEGLVLNQRFIQHCTGLPKLPHLRDVCQQNNPDINDTIEEKLKAREQLSLQIRQVLKTTQLELDFDQDQCILKLREPLGCTTPCLFQDIRWPLECEVIDDVIEHTEWDPPEPEPFYKPTECEKAYMPVGEEKGTVVYCIDPATKTPYFTSSCVGGSKGYVRTTSDSTSQSENMLHFESRFESGNLQMAKQVDIHDYELTLNTDRYTSKHVQWFYFRVRNMKLGVTYRFTIVNLSKGHSLYSLGMKPLLYSERASQESSVGWHHFGTNIKYYRSNPAKEQDGGGGGRRLYCLSWTFQFPHESDTCYVAHCYPYTYSHLQRYLSSVNSNPAVSAYCRVQHLCRSLAGNPVYLLTITSPGRMEGKKAVVMTARVHPGETNSSWVMQGILDFLLEDSDDAKLLRDTFVFKVVPMLNPDGVIVGNYRCSLAGRDLNRKYKTVLRDSYPCIWHARDMVKRLLADRDVALYCDLHGHSRKNNVFMYGCNNSMVGLLELQERVFPLMMSKNAYDKFSFRSCKFRMQKQKAGTGRIVMRKMGIKNSFTMESTFGGSTLGNRRGTHFSTQDLKSLGYCLCDTLLDYCDPDPAKTVYCLAELESWLTQIRIKKGLGKDSNCKISVSDMESSTSGSNSSDSDGLPVNIINKADTFPKQVKKRLKSRKERNRVNRLSWKRPKTTPKPIVLPDSLSPEPTKDLVMMGKQQNGMKRPMEDVTFFIFQNECPEARRLAYIQHIAKACPLTSTPITKPPHTEEPVRKNPSFLQPPLWKPQIGLRGKLPATLTAAVRSNSEMHLRLVPEVVIGKEIGLSIISYKEQENIRLSKENLEEQDNEGTIFPPLCRTCRTANFPD